MFLHTFFVSLHHQILKCMAKNLLNKYVWLVDTIYRAGKITYEEISRRWLDNDLSEGKHLPLRTFHLVAGKRHLGIPKHLSP